MPIKYCYKCGSANPYSVNQPTNCAKCSYSFGSALTKSPEPISKQKAKDDEREKLIDFYEKKRSSTSRRSRAEEDFEDEEEEDDFYDEDEFSNIGSLGVSIEGTGVKDLTTKIGSIAGSTDKVKPIESSGGGKLSKRDKKNFLDTFQKRAGFGSERAQSQTIGEE